MRSDSNTAPESITGTVERVPTVKHHGEPGTNLAAATSGEEVVSPVSPGVKKQGTLSKLFKRKPVGGAGTGNEATGVAEGERKKYY